MVQLRIFQANVIPTISIIRWDEMAKLEVCSVQILVQIRIKS